MPILAALSLLFFELVIVLERLGAEVGLELREA